MSDQMDEVDEERYTKYILGGRDQAFNNTLRGRECNSAKPKSPLMAKSYQPLGNSTLESEDIHVASDFITPDLDELERTIDEVIKSIEKKEKARQPTESENDCISAKSQSSTELYPCEEDAARTTLKTPPPILEMEGPMQPNDTGNAVMELCLQDSIPQTAFEHTSSWSDEAFGCNPLSQNVGKNEEKKNVFEEKGSLRLSVGKRGIGSQGGRKSKRLKKKKKYQERQCSDSCKKRVKKLEKEVQRLKQFKEKDFKEFKEKDFKELKEDLKNIAMRLNAVTPASVLQVDKLNVESPPCTTENTVPKKEIEDTAIWYNDKNLMNVKAPQKEPSKCALNLLDLLFTPNELQNGTLSISGKSKRQPLDPARLKKMFDVLNLKYGEDLVKESELLITKSCNQKCRDVHKKMKTMKK